MNSTSFGGPVKEYVNLNHERLVKHSVANSRYSLEASCVIIK